MVDPDDRDTPFLHEPVCKNTAYIQDVSYIGRLDEPFIRNNSQVLHFLPPRYEIQTKLRNFRHPEALTISIVTIYH
jgi:hypothetical protein